MKKATNLQSIRKQRGLSQSQLARAAEISVRTVQNFEQRHKDINNAAAITVYRLAEVLDCDIVNLLELDEKADA